MWDALISALAGRIDTITFEKQELQDDYDLLQEEEICVEHEDECLEPEDEFFLEDQSELDCLCEGIL